MAVFMTLKYFLRGYHVLVRVDNTVVVAYNNGMEVMETILGAKAPSTRRMYTTTKVVYYTSCRPSPLQDFFRAGISAVSRHMSCYSQIFCGCHLGLLRSD